LRQAEPTKKAKPIGEHFEAGTAIGKQFEWIYSPNPKQDTSPKPSRRYRESPLSKIARHSTKLPKIQFDRSLRASATMAAFTAV